MRSGSSWNLHGSVRGADLLLITDNRPKATRGERTLPSIAMVKGKDDARTGRRGQPGSRAAGAAGKQPVPVGTREEQSAQDDVSTAARLSVWAWWLEIYKAILKACGYSEWDVEAIGDCHLIAFSAGFEIAEKSDVKSLSEGNRKTLVTAGLRKPAVELLITGADGAQTGVLSEEELALTAAMLGINGRSVSLPRLMRSRLKPWLQAKHYGRDSYVINSALGVLKQRVRHFYIATRMRINGIRCVYMARSPLHARSLLAMHAHSSCAWLFLASYAWIARLAYRRSFLAAVMRTIVSPCSLLSSLESR